MAKFAAANDRLARLYQYLGSIDWGKMRTYWGEIREVNSGMCPMAVRTGDHDGYTMITANSTGLSYDYVRTVVWGAADNRIHMAYPECQKKDARRLRRWMLAKMRKARTGQIALPLT